MGKSSSTKSKHKSSRIEKKLRSIIKHVDELAANPADLRNAFTGHVLANLGAIYSLMAEVVFHNPKYIDLGRLEWHNLCLAMISQRLDEEQKAGATRDALSQVFASLRAVLSSDLSGLLAVKENSAPSVARDAVARLLRTINEGLTSLDEPQSDIAPISQLLKSFRALDAGETLAILARSKRPLKSFFAYSEVRIRLEACLCRELLQETGLSATAADHAFHASMGQNWDTARKWPKLARKVLSADEIENFLDERRESLGLPQKSRRNVFTDRLTELGKELLALQRRGKSLPRRKNSQN